MAPTRLSLSDRSAHPARHAARPLRITGALTISAVLMAGCQTTSPGPAGLAPDAARSVARKAIPSGVKDADGWAGDIQSSFSLLGLPATRGSLCATVAIIEQESNFQANPSVAGLPAIAWKAINERAARYHLPAFMIRTALALPSGNGLSYAQRIDQAHTEEDLSRTFEDLIGAVPLGKRLFGQYNPVHTGGAMQVSISYAEAHAHRKPYPFHDARSIREEIFTRRGGLYFGIAHLLDYPVDYPDIKYRFADYNAGHYASRNAAFQRALAVAIGQKLTPDGDLLDLANPSMDTPGQTERAARTFGRQIGQDEAAIRTMLQQEDSPDFTGTPIYKAVFAHADRAGGGRPMPRAILPDIQLTSPKITRKLTTAWFAERVKERYLQCLKRVGGE